MPGLNRSLAMPQDEVGVYHCFNRCVQQAFLCGFDHEKHIDYSHRKVWMREKLRRLARAFAVDLFKYSLSNPSWLMRVWCAHIGRRANQETGKSGRFFEERFKSVRLLDDAAVLACALYIDLNPIRACLAESPEQSEYTSAYDRIAGRKQRIARALAQGRDLSTLAQDGGLALDGSGADSSDADAWLSQLTLDAEQRLNGHLAEWFDEAESILWEDLEELGQDESDNVDAQFSAAELTRDREPTDAATSVERVKPTGADDALGEAADRGPAVGASARPRRSRKLSGLLHFPAPRASNRQPLLAAACASPDPDQG